MEKPLASRLLEEESRQLLENCVSTLTEAQVVAKPLVSRRPVYQSRAENAKAITKQKH